MATDTDADRRPENRHRPYGGVGADEIRAARRAAVYLLSLGLAAVVWALARGSLTTGLTSIALPVGVSIAIYGAYRYHATTLRLCVAEAHDD